MIECKNCGIKIKDKTKVCPMCDMVLSGDDKHNENTYPDVRQKTKILRRIVSIFSYFAIVVIWQSSGPFNGVKWSEISGGAILYLILMLHFIINDHYGHIKKMYVGFLGALFYIMLVDFVLGYKGWSLGVGMPVIVLVLDVIIIICMIINRQNWESYLLLQIFCVILGIVQMLLYFTKVLQSPVLPWTSFLVSLILFTSSVVIGDRKARNELKRKFYI